MSEASGISAQKERKAGEVGAGAGERLSRRPGQRGAAPVGCGVRLTHVALVGCRRDRRPGICRSGCLQSNPRSRLRAGWEGRGGRSGSAGSRGTLAWRLRATEKHRSPVDEGGETRAGGSQRLQGPAPLLSALPEAEKGPRALGRGWCKVLRRTRAVPSVCAAGISATPWGDPSGTGGGG